MYSESEILLKQLGKSKFDFFPILPFEDNDKALQIRLKDLSITPEILADTQVFTEHMDDIRKKAGARYLYGGYRENRTIYERSILFGSGKHQRTLHLGVDVWCEAGTPVFMPVGGMVHSMAFNEGNGNYGATIIMQYHLDMVNFYILYGHVSLKDMEKLEVGVYLSRGTQFAHVGSAEENGNWPPHLHIQLITDIGTHEGDYPGVCKLSETKYYTDYCPDPTILLPF